MSTKTAATALKDLKSIFIQKRRAPRDEVFKTARALVKKRGGKPLSEEPGAIKGWLVDFLYFPGDSNLDSGDILYIMWRDTKDGNADLGLALDSYPTTPPWLKEMAWSMVSIVERK